MTVGVVVPAYNEEGYVGPVIEDLPSFVDRAYVIDDGSTDGTWEEIRHHASVRNETHDGHFPDLVVPIQHEENRGVGGAIKTGYQRARAEGIEATAVLGGDNQMDPAELTAYLDPIAAGVADYTKGNRFSDPAHWQAMPRFRFVGNVMLSYLTKIASGYWETMDSQNGYTAISLTALEETDIDGMYEYYGYCNDLLVRLNAADMRVADVPRSSTFAYSDDWKSHIDYREYVPRVSVMLLRSFLWRLRRKYLITGFNPVALRYILGIVVTGVSLLGLVVSTLRRRGSQPATWGVSTVLGVLTLLQAIEADWEENAHLEYAVEREAVGRDGQEFDIEEAERSPQTSERSDDPRESPEGEGFDESPEVGSPTDGDGTQAVSTDG